MVNVLGGYRKTIKYKYACSILSVLPEDDDEDDGLKVWVMGLRVVDEYATTFKTEDTDVFIIDFNQILGILPDPELVEKDRRILMVFPGTVSVYEQG